ARWAADNRAALQRSEPAMPEHLFNRQADNWRPLFAIAEAAGGEWPARAKAASLDGRAQPEESARTQLLADIRTVFAEMNCDRVTSQDLADALVAKTDRPWGECNRGKPLTQNQLARRLNPFGIAPKTIRTGKGTPKGYLREGFKDAFERYLAVHTPLQTATPQQSIEINDLGEDQTATPEKHVAVSNSVNQLKSEEC